MVAGNTAGMEGGGIYNQSYGVNDQAIVTLNNYATIQDNNAGATGGGIYNLFGILNNAIPGGNVFGNKPNDIF
jgi:hypothetical protein